MDLPIETCRCPLCGSDVAKATPYGRGPYAVVRCEDCGLWYLSPRLVGRVMRDHYARGDYFEGGDAGYADYGGQERSLRRTFHRLLQQLDRQGLTGGALLEIGCGYGYLLDVAGPYFEARYGTEMSVAAAARAETSDVTVYRGGIEDVPSDLLVDVIAAAHVIEHVYDPLPFVEQALRHLPPGGVLVLAAPDMGSMWRLVMQRSWPSFKFPEHVTFFDAQTLPALMRRAGLTDLVRLPYVHDFPLDEILRKLRLPASPRLRHVAVPLPATTVCFAGRKPADGASTRHGDVAG